MISNSELKIESSNSLQEKLFKLLVGRSWYNQGDFDWTSSLKTLVKVINDLDDQLIVTAEELQNLFFTSLQQNLTQLEFDNKQLSLVVALKRLVANYPELKIILWTEGDPDFQCQKIQYLNLEELESIVTQDKTAALQALDIGDWERIYVLDDKAPNLEAVQQLAEDNELEVKTYLVDLNIENKLQQIVELLREDLADNGSASSLILLDLDRVVLNVDQVWRDVSIILTQFASK